MSPYVACRTRGSFQLARGGYLGQIGCSLFDRYSSQSLEGERQSSRAYLIPATPRGTAAQLEHARTMYKGPAVRTSAQHAGCVVQKKKESLNMSHTRTDCRSTTGSGKQQLQLAEQPQIKALGDCVGLPCYRQGIALHQRDLPCNGWHCKEQETTRPDLL